MFWTATQVYIAQNTTPENKGRYASYSNASFYMGSFIGALLFSYMINSYSSDYYTAMYLMIVFPVISALFILFKFHQEEENK